ncbi:hypothetical protein NADFUDRAFT_44672 [Nadsonia fulvescens var. elongata DSM 6958]|uniref:MICOS complex subunit MIC60 n=1 Tax=Nadsonia fulvescens var. elongata DSM 6958 TaxID=857566 RepID=A0A1E3PRD5_9ASCO|nr:hypothetical protein NADFUDRAFT_44672 [Nadsonia fulvescens var. elongata DSM 6958]
MLRSNTITRSRAFQRALSSRTASVHTSAIRQNAGATISAGTKTSGGGFKKFFALAALFSTVSYGGLIFASLKNDTIHGYVTDFIPFSDSLIVWIENQRFQKRFRANTGQSPPLFSSSALPAGFDVKVEIPRSGVNSRAIDSSANTTKKMSQETPIVVKVPEVILPLISIPKDADALITKSTEALNELISQVNDKSVDETHVKNVAATINDLHSFITSTQKSLKESLQTEFNKQVKALDEASAQEVKALEDTWLKRYQEQQQVLLDEYNKKLATEIQATKDAINGLAANKLTSLFVEREQQYAQEIANKVETEHEGRLSKLAELSSSVAELEEITSKSNTVIHQADNAVRLHRAIAKLSSAIKDSKPVALGPFIAAIEKVAGEDPLLKAAIASIPTSVYTEGVLTPAQLAARLKLIEPEIRKASLLPEDAGIAGHLGSIIFSKLLWKKSGAPAGDDIESIFSRAEVFLEQGNIYEAVAEINTLKGWPKKLAHDWLDQGRKRTEVDFLIQVLSENAKLWGVKL